MYGTNMFNLWNSKADLLIRLFIFVTRFFFSWINFLYKIMQAVQVIKAYKSFGKPETEMRTGKFYSHFL